MFTRPPSQAASQWRKIGLASNFSSSNIDCDVGKDLGIVNIYEFVFDAVYSIHVYSIDRTLQQFMSENKLS